MPVGGGVVAPEQLEGAGLGRGREGEERQVGLPASGRHRLGQRVLRRVGRLVRLGTGRLAAEHRLERGRRITGLGRVGLVDDHRVGPVGEALDLLGDERELLERGDDDAGLLARQGVGQLLGVLVDSHHDAVGVLELVDRLLQLLVEDAPVGDDHDLVEHLVVGVVVERGQAVGQPGQRVRLAGTGRVLHQVVVPGALLASGGGEGEHGVPLVEPGEDHRCRRLRPLRGRLDVHEPVEEVEPGVALPHPLPQVGGAVPVGVRRVPAAEVVAPVEGQEAGRLARQPGRHRHPLGVDREVDDRPPQERVRGVAIAAVLLDRLVDALPGDGVLQLGRGHRDAVDEQAQVDRLGRACLVRKLAGHGQPVLAVALQQRRA